MVRGCSVRHFKEKMKGERWGERRERRDGMGYLSYRCITSLIGNGREREKGVTSCIGYYLLFPWSNEEHLHYIRKHSFFALS